MRRLLLALTALLALLPVPARAWDPVTHGHITDLAIAEVRDPQLKALLTTHRDALLTGADFPDWGHSLRPHGEKTHTVFLDAGFDDLADPRVKGERNYQRWLAHYFGAYAHVVEDRLLDATLKRYAAEIGEAHRDDMENGMLLHVSEGLLLRDHAYYTPYEDLARVYAKANYFGEPRLNAANLIEQMQRGQRRGQIRNRPIKLLSFLANGELQRVYPWGAIHLVDGPGGVQAQARAVAAGWDALWAQLHGRSAPFFTYVTPEPGGSIPVLDNRSAFGRITVVTRHRIDVRRLTPDMVTLTDSQGRRIPVSIHTYIDVPDHEVDVAFQIQAKEPWRPGEIYGLDIAPGPYAPARAGTIAPLHLHFGAPTHALYTNVAHPSRPWAMGIFLFVFAGGIAGMVFGLLDLLRLVLAERAESLWFKGADLVLKGTGLAILALALWLLWTNGAAYVDWLHFHH